MNKLVKLLFQLYWLVRSRSHPTCRFQPTCSRYAYQAIEKYGILKGSLLTLKRIAACHPFSKRPSYDPA